MGLRNWLGLRGQPSMVSLGTRSFVFPSTTEASAFISSYGSTRGGYLDWMGSHSRASQYGGVFLRSTAGRELSVLGRQPAVYLQDCRYLADRDPLASMLVEKPAKDCWSALPRTYIEPTDAWFAYLESLGLSQKAAHAQKCANRDGLSYLLVHAPGASDTRLQRGDSPIGFHVIYIDDLPEPDNEAWGPIYAEGAALNDPLIRDHGIQYLSYYPPTDKDHLANPVTIHGSRLIQFRGTEEGESVLRRIFDDLQDLRDITFSRTRAHFQGDPIVVEVDLSTEASLLMDWANMSDADKKAMATEAESALRAFSQGSKSTFAPVMGYKMKRLGAADLPESADDIGALIGRIAAGSPFPAKLIANSTKGSSSVEDQDLLTYAANINNDRHHRVYPALFKLDMVGRTVGWIPARTEQYPGPLDLEWPLIRPLSPRDRAFTDSTDLRLATMAWQHALGVPARIARKFPRQDDTPVPPWLAKSGKKRDGTSADPQPIVGASPPDEEELAEIIAARVGESILDKTLEEKP